MNIEATVIQQYNKAERKFVYIPWLVVDGKQTQVMGGDGETIFNDRDSAYAMALAAKDQLENEQ